MQSQHFNSSGPAADAIEIVNALATHLDHRLDAMESHIDERFDKVEALTNGQERRISTLEDKMRQVATKLGLTFSQ